MTVKYFRQLEDQTGQSLLELIVALSILVIALTATIILVVNSINAGREGINRQIATNLAREGIELVRNIRDSNWIDPADPKPSWDEGLNADPTAVPVIDGTNPVALDFGAANIGDTSYTQLLLSGSEYWQGGPAVDGNATFFRLITFSTICRAPGGTETIEESENGPGNICSNSNDTEVGLKVVSEVRWPSAGSGRRVIVEERIYDWQIL